MACSTLITVDTTVIRKLTSTAEIPSRIHITGSAVTTVRLSNVTSSNNPAPPATYMPTVGNVFHLFIAMINAAINTNSCGTAETKDPSITGTIELSMRRRFTTLELCALR